jgi:hypothetical protein
MTNEKSDAEMRVSRMADDLIKEAEAATTAIERAVSGLRQLLLTPSRGGANDGQYSS